MGSNTSDHQAVAHALLVSQLPSDEGGASNFRPAKWDSTVILQRNNFEPRMSALGLGRVKTALGKDVKTIGVEKRLHF
jgi:hypothetical protein